MDTSPFSPALLDFFAGDFLGFGLARLNSVGHRACAEVPPVGRRNRFVVRQSEERCKFSRFPAKSGISPDLGRIQDCAKLH
jgi:hypothetical protein